MSQSINRIEQDRYTAMLEAADLYISDQNIPPRVKEANLRVMGEHLCGLADGLQEAEERRLTRAAELLRAPDTSAIELLVRIKDKVLTDENYDADEIVREIDAVLKTAGRR